MLTKAVVSNTGISTNKYNEKLLENVNRPVIWFHLSSSKTLLGSGVASR